MTTSRKKTAAGGTSSSGTSGGGTSRAAIIDAIHRHLDEEDVVIDSDEAPDDNSQAAKFQRIIAILPHFKDVASFVPALKVTSENAARKEPTQC